jgi:hypothetical protein
LEIEQRVDFNNSAIKKNEQHLTSMKILLSSKKIQTNREYILDHFCIGEYTIVKYLDLIVGI